MASLNLDYIFGGVNEKKINQLVDSAAAKSSERIKSPEYQKQLENKAFYSVVGQIDRERKGQVKAGDRKYGITAREARVVSVKTKNSYLGNTDYTIQSYVLKRNDGKTAAGQQIIDYRGSLSGVTLFKPLKEGQNVVAWWPDKRQGVYNASVANNENTASRTRTANETRQEKKTGYEKKSSGSNGG